MLKSVSKHYNKNDDLNNSSNTHNSVNMLTKNYCLNNRLGKYYNLEITNTT